MANKYNYILNKIISGEEVRDIIQRKNISGSYYVSEHILNKIKEENISEDKIELLENILYERKKYYESVTNSFSNLQTMGDVSCFYGFKKEDKDVFAKLIKNKKYSRFYIPKKSGGFREISSPDSVLMYLQQRLNFVLNLIYMPSDSVHGFVINRNILSNALQHVGKNVVINIDIKDFFPSVKISRLFEMFMKEPFRFSELIARYFSELCTYNNCLPQGAPTSPVISNFICRKIDARLIKLAKENDCSYSRYADDITFSSDSKICVKEIIRPIVSILNDEGFQCNDAKIRYQFKHKRQEVTGITVNEKLNIPRRYIRNLRVILNDWKVNGLEKASERYKKKYSKYLINGYPLFVNSVRGKIDYVGKVRGKDDDVYHKLLNSFNNLLGKSIDSGKDNQEKVQKIDKKKEYIVKGRYEHNSHLSHDPVELSKALNKFTVEGNFLKKLVHDPNDDKPCLDLELILNESKSELNEIKNKIPYELYNNIEKNLIKKYEKDGLRIWKKNNQLHPLSDYDFKSKIKLFKKSYRFGYAGKEETNIYHSLMNIINDKFTEYSPLFKFKNENLISRISCYTDVQQVINGITALISNILKNTEDIEEIHIDIEEDKCDAHSTKTLIINSIGVSSRYDLHNTLNRFKENKGDISALRDKYSKDGHFFTRCDWKIEGFFEKEGYYELSLLDRNRPDLDIIYSKLNFNESKRYFKNKIIFYEFVK